jgi:hypothetical protein
MTAGASSSSPTYLVGRRGDRQRERERPNPLGLDSRAIGRFARGVIPGKFASR